MAAVIESAGKFLVIEEKTRKGVCLNQPAGHFDPGESLIATLAREALEETAYHVAPRALDQSQQNPRG